MFLDNLVNGLAGLMIRHAGAYLIRRLAFLCAVLAVSFSTVAQTVVFTDDSVQDLPLLLSAIRPDLNARIVRLEPGKDAVTQMTAVFGASVGGDKKFREVHIISHGEPGALLFSNARLDRTALEQHAAQIRSWRGLLSPDATLFLYGCRVAAGPEGRSFVSALRDLAGCRVAGAENSTGAAELGGEWKLVNLDDGRPARIAFEASALSQWKQILGTASTTVNTELLLTFTGPLEGRNDGRVGEFSYDIDFISSSNMRIYIHGTDIHGNSTGDQNYVATPTPIYGGYGNGGDGFYFKATQAGTYTFKMTYYDQIGNPIDSQVTVVVTVTGPNTAPIFVQSGAGSLTVEKNASATDIKSLLHVNDSDSSQTLTWSQSSGPGHGTLNISSATASTGSTDITPGGTITYTPAANYAGSDSFAVQVSDGTATATRTINVTVNVTPSFVGSTTSLSVNQNASATDIKGLLHVSDTSPGQTLTWSQSSLPNHGTLSIASSTASSGSADVTPGGTLTYAPSPGYAGSDGFTVQVSDGFATTTRTITVSVNDVTAPTVVSIVRKNSAAQRSSSSTAVFTVTFSEAVQNVTTGSFAVTAVNGSNVVGSVASVSPSSGSLTTYDVTVNITSGRGEFRLDVLSP